MWLVVSWVGKPISNRHEALDMILITVPTPKKEKSKYTWITIEVLKPMINISWYINLEVTLKLDEFLYKIKAEA